MMFQRKENAGELLDSTSHSCGICEIRSKFEHFIPIYRKFVNVIYDCLSKRKSRSVLSRFDFTLPLWGNVRTK